MPFDVLWQCHVFLGPQWFSKDCYIHKIFGVSELSLKPCEGRPHQRRPRDKSLLPLLPDSQNNTMRDFRIYRT